jgi:hypothetical protein
MVVAVGGLAGCADNGGPADDGQGETPADDAEGQPQTGDGEQGALRVAHASPDAPNVDVYIDGEAAIEDLGFGEVSPYAALDPGTYQVQVTAAGDEETVVFDEQIELDAGVTQTAVAFGEAAGGPDTGFRIELLDDDLTDPGEGMSRLRLFHAVPDAGTVDIVVVDGPEGEGDGGNESTDVPSEGEPLFAGVEFGGTVAESVPEGDYTLEVVPAGSGGESTTETNTTQAGNDTHGANDTLGENDTQGGNDTQEENNTTDQGTDDQQADGPAAEVDLEADGQTVYTAFAIGYLDPEAVGSEATFEVVTVTDASEGERAQGGTDSGAMFSPTA